MKDKFGRIVQLVGWLDKAAWQGELASRLDLLHVSRFNQLGDAEKVLVHWLCYITLRMRPFRPVWKEGGRILSEVVSRFVTNKVRSETDLMDQVLGRDSGFLTKPQKKGKIDRFTSREDESIQPFGPRYKDDFYSVAKTLVLLLNYEKRISDFLEKKKAFWLRGADNIGRISYLLYLLSYDGLTKGFPNFQGVRRDRFLRKVARRRATLDGNLEPGYAAWSKSGRFGAKRLWSAVRDYVKPFSPFREFMLNSSSKDLRKVLIKPNLYELEFPGDVWNKRFSENLLRPLLSDKKVDGKKVYVRNVSQMMRRAFESLSEKKRGEYYPEQFDMSFDFAPRMCESKMQDFCLFRKGRAERVCWKRQYQEVDSGRLKDKYCPVVLVSCGYAMKCQPKGCPIAQHESEDLCSGCS